MNRTNLPPLTTAVPENFVLFGVPSTSSSEIQGGRRSLLFSFIATLVRTNPIVMVPRAIVQSESEGDMVARVLATGVAASLLLKVILRKENVALLVSNFHAILQRLFGGRN